jgi:hypothetical protein
MSGEVSGGLWGVADVKAALVNLVPRRNLYTRLCRCNTALMNISEWWPLVDAETRGWLIEHNGEPLPPHVIAHIVAVTAGTSDSEWWAGESADGPRHPDEAVDWIEAAASDEEPTAADIF